MLVGSMQLGIDPHYLLTDQQKQIRTKVNSFDRQQKLEKFRCERLKVLEECDKSISSKLITSVFSVDKRISDLTGRNSTIPDLKDMQSLHVLILRNCLINGALPEYFGVFGQLKTLDLSFNRRSGRSRGWFHQLLRVIFRVKKPQERADLIAYV
ncbi:hypothetical protein AgCh_001433 [Apium graveolens]